MADYTNSIDRLRLLARRHRSHADAIEALATAQGVPGGLAATVTYMRAKADELDHVASALEAGAA